MDLHTRSQDSLGGGGHSPAHGTGTEPRAGSLPGGGGEHMGIGVGGSGYEKRDWIWAFRCGDMFRTRGTPWCWSLVLLECSGKYEAVGSTAECSKPVVAQSVRGEVELVVHVVPSCMYS